MILKLIIKNNKKNNKNKKITIWIQQHEDFKSDIQQLFQFFKDDIKISKKRRFYNYYKITSDKPAIMMSLFSTAQEIIPEIYFNEENPIDVEDSLNIDVEQY